MENPRIKFCFDPQHPTVDERLFAVQNWYDFYQDSKEDIPADAPSPRVNVVSTHYFVDADHSGDKATRRFQTGVLIFVNRLPYCGTVSYIILSILVRYRASSSLSRQQPR